VPPAASWGSLQGSEASSSTCGFRLPPASQQLAGDIRGARVSASGDYPPQSARPDPDPPGGCGSEPVLSDQAGAQACPISPHRRVDQGRDQGRGVFYTPREVAVSTGAPGAASPGSFAGDSYPAPRRLSLGPRRPGSGCGAAAQLARPAACRLLGALRRRHRQTPRDSWHPLAQRYPGGHPARRLLAPQSAGATCLPTTVSRSQGRMDTLIRRLGGSGPAVCIGRFPWRATQERVTMPILMLASPFTVTQRRPYGYH
jgi:hypothetical protein